MAHICVSPPRGPQGPAGTANLPYVDVQSYGAIPRNASSAVESTTASTTATSPNITIGSALSFSNGSGVCIYKAGNATAQSTPSAPTVSSPSVKGSQTITYKVVGVDALGGFTAASLAGTVTDAPNVFGIPAVAISSISQSSGTVTVNFSSPLAPSVSAGQVVRILNVGAPLAAANGTWTIATSPSTSQITFALAGNAGAGGVTASTTGRLTNAQPVTAISRDAAGNLTITTANNHNYHVISGGDASFYNPTLIFVQGSDPDFNGTYVAKTLATTNIVCQTANTFARTGTVAAGATFARSYEFIDVTCPAYSGTTIAYYIYSDSPNPGGALQLIGKTLPSEVHFRDWGPFLGSGFVAPSYVPTTPPVAAQNQLFASTILSGGGTTSLVLNDIVPSTVIGSTIVHDDAICVKAAMTAAAANGNNSVYLSPPTSASSSPTYVFSYPLSGTASVNILAGCKITVNETWTVIHGTNVLAPFLGPGSRSYQFDIGPQISVFGVASPLIYAGGESTSGSRFEGLLIAVGDPTSNTLNYHNYQYGLVIDNSWSIVDSCFFSGGQSACSVPLVYNGQASWATINDTQFSGSGAYDLVGDFTAPIPSVWIHASDNPANPSIGIGVLAITGNSSLNYRGVLADCRNAASGPFATQITVGNGPEIESQQPQQPALMVWGQAAYSISLNNVLNDSAPASVFGNYTQQGASNLCIHNPGTSGSAPIITGSSCSGVSIDGGNTQLPYWAAAGQADSMTYDVLGGSVRTPVQTASNPANAGCRYEGKPVIALGNGMFAAAIPPVTGVTAAQSASAGTFPAGTYTVTVSTTGWDGGESSPSRGVSVTIDGSHGIDVSWSAVLGSFQGYNVNIAGHRQNASPLTTTSTTITTYSAGALPTLADGTGLASLTASGVVAPQIVMGSAFTAVKLTGITAATASAGGGQATPGTVLGYITGFSGATPIKIPYFAA